MLEGARVHVTRCVALWPAPACTVRILLHTPGSIPNFYYYGVHFAIWHLAPGSWLPSWWEAWSLFEPLTRSVPYPPPPPNCPLAALYRPSTN